MQWAFAKHVHHTGRLEEVLMGLQNRSNQPLTSRPFLSYWGKLVNKSGFPDPLSCVYTEQTNAHTFACVWWEHTNMQASTYASRPPSKFKINRLLQLTHNWTMQNKHEGNDYQLTNNKGTLWVQRSSLIWVSSWGISKGFHKRSIATIRGGKS